jgi:acyl carrier protein
MNTSIMSNLRTILKDDLFIDADSASIREDDGLQSVLGLDSVGFVELRVACEYRFGIDIPDADFIPENFRCLGVLADYIEGQITQATR